MSLIVFLKKNYLALLTCWTNRGDRSNVLGLPRLHQTLRVSTLDHSMELLLLSCEKAHATHIKRNQNTQLTALAECRSRDQNQLIRLVSEPSEGAQSYSLGQGAPVEAMQNRDKLSS